MKQIPPELYPTIFTYLSPEAWVKVGATSRAFHYETNRLLYRDIDLYDRSRIQILGWADAVSHNSSLSELVRAVRLPSLIAYNDNAHNRRFQPERLQMALKNAFEAVVNLISLKIRDEPTGNSSSKYMHYLDFALLTSSKFRLKSFHVFVTLDTLHDPHETVSFLLNQPDIEDWAQGARHLDSESSAITEDMLSSSFLPNLSTFELLCHYPFDLPLLEFVTSRRPLVRLAVEFKGENPVDHDPLIRILGCVHLCHQTLLHFHYCAWNSDVGDDFITSSVEQIQNIAQQLPGLKSLRYARIKDWTTVRPMNDLVICTS